MPIYSHSQLSMYEECPLKYKFCYRDGIKRDTESIEGFLGLMVHETLKKCYDDVRLTKLNHLNDLLVYYDNLWQKNWHGLIIITRKDLTPEHYQALGQKMLETYYRRHAPFAADITIGTEMRLLFSLDDKDKYQFTGWIDRLSRTEDGVYHIHDYKTSAYLPGQEQADNDRQLALYQLGVQRKWPEIKEIELVWHYLAFDCELVSSRSEGQIATLVAETTRLVDEVEAAVEFPPRDSDLCLWCEYPDLCPRRKHLYTVEALPANEYLAEPGVTLVNKYAELKGKAAEVDAELVKVKEALFDYARREGVTVIRGSDHKVSIKTEKKLKFPGKNETERQALDKTIIQAGKWLEVSQLDITVLNQAIEGHLWDKELIEQVMKYGRLEETSAIYLSRLKAEEPPR